MACSSGELEKEVSRLQNLKSSLLIVRLRKEVRELGGDPGEADRLDNPKDKPARVARQTSTTSSRSSSETAPPKRKKRAKKRSPPPSDAVKMQQGQEWAQSMEEEMISTHQLYKKAPMGTQWAPTRGGHYDISEVREAAMQLKDFQRKKQQQQQQQQQSPLPPLPTGWKEYVDQGSRDMFYHSKDGETTWDRPTPSDTHPSDSEESEEAVKSGPDSPIQATTPTTLTPRAGSAGSQEPQEEQAKGRSKGKKGGKKAPRGARTQICKYQHRRGGCQNGLNCRFVHNERWKVCYFWKEWGKCRKGDRCPMAHPQAEEKNEPSPRTRLRGGDEEQDASASYHSTPSEADSSYMVEAVASPVLPREGVVLTSAARVVPPVFGPPPGEPPAGAAPVARTSSATSSIIKNTIVQGMVEEPVCWQAPKTPKEVEEKKANAEPKTVSTASASKKPSKEIKTEPKEEQ